MTETQLLLNLVASLFAILIMLLGWLGNKLYSRMGDMGKEIHSVASDLHTRINSLDTRVTKIETRCNMEHLK